MEKQTTKHSTKYRTVQRVAHRTGSVVRGTSRWLWSHKRTLLVPLIWFSAGVVVSSYCEQSA